MRLIDYYLSHENFELSLLIHYLSLNEGVDKYIQQRESCDEFDKEFGTLTGLIIRQYELPESISLSRFETSGRCSPSPTASFKLSLQHLESYDIDYRLYVFIDIGAGLGRNLLIASDFHFSKVIGVEQSAFLCKKIWNNIDIYRSKKEVGNIFEVQCIDALEYRFPDANSVLYFWRPFSDEMATLFVKRLEAFIKSTSFTVLIINLGKVYPAFENCLALEILDSFFTPDLFDGPGKYYEVTIFRSKINPAEN